MAARNRKFLEARWQNLCLFNFAVSPEFLEPLLLPGTKADLLEGKAFLSLVAFDFLDTKVFGIKWPGFVDFPEINLRFYVRKDGERGVVFVRELVPQPLVAFLARFFYNEPYQSCPMQSSLTRTQEKLEIEHKFFFAGKKQRLSLVAEDLWSTPPESSKEHFFKEHRWGYGKKRNGETSRYEVDHPVWETAPVLSYELNLDFAEVYGEYFKTLNDLKPDTVTLARGSKIAVYGIDQ